MIKNINSHRTIRPNQFAKSFNEKWTIEQLQENINFQPSIKNDYFLDACGYNRLDAVEYLLLKSPFHRADIHASNDFAILNACGRGQLDIVKFLLTSPKLDERINVNTRNGEHLAYSLTYNQLHVTKYLLTLGCKIDIKNYAIEHEHFTSACELNSLLTINFLFDRYSEQINMKKLVKNTQSKVVSFIQNKLKEHKILKPSIFDNFKKIIQEGLQEAAKRGNIEVLELIMNKDDANQLWNMKNLIEEHGNEKAKNWYNAKSLTDKLSNTLKQNINQSTQNNSSQSIKRRKI
jgi:hypothetical protein